MKKLAGAAVVAALVLGACGSDKGGAGVTVVGGPGPTGGDGGGADAVGGDGGGGADATGGDGGAGSDGGVTDGGGGDGGVTDAGAGPDGGGADGAGAEDGVSLPDTAAPDTASPDTGGPDTGGPVTGGPDTTGCDPAACDDGDPCTTDGCDGVQCTYDTIPGCCVEDGDCVSGTLCEAGVCVPACDAAAARGWQAGCEHWAVDLDQYDEAAVVTLPEGVPNPPDAPWGISVSNPGNATAHLTFLANTPALQAQLDLLPDPTVLPDATKTWELPQLDLAEPGIKESAIRIVSDQPVSIVQQNPLDLAQTGTTDSSLLLPAHLLGTEHYAASWKTTPTLTFPLAIPGQRGTLTIVATAEGTTSVTVKPTVALDAGAGPLAPGKAHAFELAQYEILELQAGPPAAGSTAGGDLTGTRVASDKAVAVFTGHEEAALAPPSASDDCCADHLEEQLLPVERWGTAYIAAKTHPRGNDPDLWRVVAAAGVTLATDPAIAGLDGVTLAAGEVAQAFTDETFALSATGPVQLVQYTIGGKAVGAQIGDPSLMIAVPTASFGTSAVFEVPATYTESWISVVRPPGATVLLDGAPIPATVEAAVGGYELVYVLASAGAHTLDGDAPFGATLYGWYKSSSYGHTLLMGAGPAQP